MQGINYDYRPEAIQYALKFAYMLFWHCSNLVPIMLDFMPLHNQL